MQMSNLEWVSSCTVRIVSNNELQGTGFFTNPGIVLTCAHVVRELKVVQAVWSDQALSCEILSLSSGEYPDIAVIQVKRTDHPVIELDGAPNVSEQLYSYGYSDEYPFGDPVTFIYEGEGELEDGSPVVKFKGGQVRPGLSGSPLINLRTNKACGMIRKTRDRGSDLGGRGTPSRVLTLALQNALDKHGISVKSLNLVEKVARHYVPSRNEMREKLSRYFNLRELRTIAFDLGIDVDDFHTTKTEFIIDLISYTERHNLDLKLLEMCAQLREHFLK